MNTKYSSRMCGFLLASILAVSVIDAGAAPYVINKAGMKIQGTKIRMGPDGSVVLTTTSGATTTFTKSMYRKVYADKPAGYNAAVKLIEAGKYDRAITALKKIAANYFGLRWDDAANLQIARALAGKKDFTASISLYESLFKKSPHLQKQTSVIWAYYQTLMDANRYGKLEPILKKMIAQGSRSDAARAQLMRADIKAKRGELEAALLDYLRTAVFFESENDVMPQATLKTAQILERLRDGRAKTWYRKVVEKYPKSPEAKVAKTKI